MISLKYRKAVYHCFTDSHTKAIFERMISGITSVLIYDAGDTSDIEDIFALRDDLGKYFDEPKKQAEVKQ